MIKLSFLGDIMCKATMIKSYKVNDKYDFSSIFSEVKSLLATSDYVFANLETPISYDNNSLTNVKFCFNSPFEFAQAVYEAGIHFVATANNHCLDRGIKGIESTVKSLDKIGFKHTGIFANQEELKPLVLEVNGIKIGMVSYTYGTNAFANHQYLNSKEKWHVNLFQNQELSNPIDKLLYTHKDHPICFPYKVIGELMHRGNMTRPVYERREADSSCKRKIVKDIRTLKNESVDLIIMYMHVGGQYNNKPMAYTKSLTDWLLNLGVNIIVGSHEHVVHGGIFNRMSENKIATYSLGNFDGVAGIYEAPFDKMAEYTVVWHVYINDDKWIEKTTYSILKTIPTQDSGIKVVPCLDLLNENKQKGIDSQKLIDDMISICEVFSGVRCEENMLTSEAELPIM